MTNAFSSRLRTTFYAVATTTGLVFSATACSSDNQATESDDSQDSIKIVTSTNVWTDIAKEVVGDAKDIEVTPIIESNDIDPHSYQPTAADMSTVEKADILVAGGGHYDAWLTSAASDQGEQVIISALAPVAEHDADHDAEHNHEAETGHEGHDHEDEVNEHIWYSTDAVKNVAEQLAKELNLSDDAVVKKMDDIEKRKDKLPAAKTAQVHPLADDIISDTKIHDLTPRGYRASTLNESEPSAADVNEMLKLIESGDLDFLIDAPQTHDQVSERILEAAKAKGIRIVNVYESPAQGQSYFDLYDATLDELEQK